MLAGLSGAALSGLGGVAQMSTRYCLLQHVGLFVFCGLVSISCWAQTPSPEQQVPLRLTLKEAVQMAMKQNPQRLIARIAAQQADRTRQIALSALLPQAGLHADGDLQQYNIVTIEKAPKRAAAGPYQFIEAGPAYSQTILNLPEIRGYQIGREGVREALASENITREQVTQFVVTQYLLVLRAIAAYEAAQARVALAERLLQQATNLEKSGVGLAIDTVRANVELQNEKQTLIDTGTETSTTKYALAELLDLPRNQLPEPSDPLSFFDLPAYDRSAMVGRAFEKRPEMQSIESQQRIASLSRQQARDQIYPELDFKGFWSYQGEHFNDGIPAYAYEISLQIPLFTGGRIHAETQRASLEEQRIAEQRRALGDRIVREVKSAVDQLEAARSSVDVANLGFKLANDEVAQAQRRFQAGVTTNIEVITAQDELARASDSQIEALYQFNQSRANLALAIGEIESTYTQ
jgi:outer membrane protein